MSAHSPYEQLKDDFGYLGLDAAAECFATLAEEAMAESWPPVVYLERVIAAQASADAQPSPQCPAALRALPEQADARGVRLLLPADDRQKADQRPRHVALRH